MFKTTISILFVLILLSIEIVPAQSAPSASTQAAMALMPPEKLLESTPGFPQDEAGLTLVADMGEVEYRRLYDAIISFVELGNSDGSTYIWGWTTKTSETVFRDYVQPGSRGPAGAAGHSWNRSAAWADQIGVYVDITGSIILFFPKGTPTTQMISWASPPNGGTNVLADKNILEQVLEIILSSFRKSFGPTQNTINYTHFEYPNATAITLFALYGCGKTISLLVPDGLTLHESSFTILSYDAHHCSLFLNAKGIIDATTTGRYTGEFETTAGRQSIETGVSTDISTTGSQSASAAFVLLWSIEE